MKTSSETLEVSEDVEKAENYSETVQVLISSYSANACNMSLKLHFIAMQYNINTCLKPTNCTIYVKHLNPFLSFTLKHIYIPPTCFDPHTGSSSGSMHYIESEVTKTSYIYRLSGSMRIQVMPIITTLATKDTTRASIGDDKHKPDSIGIT